MTNSVDPDQTAPIGAVCSESTLFTSILNSSVMLGNYLQQTTSVADIFRCIFSWRFKRLISYSLRKKSSQKCAAILWRDTKLWCTLPPITILYVCNQRGSMLDCANAQARLAGRLM